MRFLMRSTARLPWWAYGIAALIGFGLLSQFLPRSAAVTAARYVLLAIGLAAAAASFYSRRKQAQWQQRVSELGSIAIIDTMDWQEFMRRVGEGFRRRGFWFDDAQDTSRMLLEMNRGREMFLVQCRHWRAFKVGAAAVHELRDAMAARHAAGGFVLTSGVFEPDAASVADKHEIRLLDGMALQELIHSGDEKTIPLVRRRSSDDER